MPVDLDPATLGLTPDDMTALDRDVAKAASIAWRLRARAGSGRGQLPDGGRTQGLLTPR